MNVSYHSSSSCLVLLVLRMVGFSLNVKGVVVVVEYDATEAILNVGAFEKQCQPWWIATWNS